MQKNWYIIYTKPGAEKKVAASLARKKIEHFLPLCNKLKNNVALRKLVKEPLFTGYVFVFIATSRLIKVQQRVGALSVVYWKGKPAIIPSRDIQNIKDFSSCHDRISLISIKVNSNEESRPVDPPPLVVNETLVTQQNHFLKIRVPSMGYILAADGERETERESIFKEKEKALY